MDFRVGPWLVRPALNRIVNGSHSSRITPKSMEVLVCLAKRSGEVVSKDTLFQEAWPGTHVTDDALTKCIGELRRVFHSTKGEPAVIETIAKDKQVDREKGRVSDTFAIERGKDTK